MAYIIMASIIMADIVMAYTVMACIGTAYIVMADIWPPGCTPTQRGAFRRRSHFRRRKNTSLRRKAAWRACLRIRHMLPSLICCKNGNVAITGTLRQLVCCKNSCVATTVVRETCVFGGARHGERACTSPVRSHDSYVAITDMLQQLTRWRPHVFGGARHRERACACKS